MSALHAADLGLIPRTIYDPSSSTRSDSCAKKKTGLSPDQQQQQKTGCAPKMKESERVCVCERGGGEREREKRDSSMGWEHALHRGPSSTPSTA